MAGYITIVVADFHLPVGLPLEVIRTELTAAKWLHERTPQDEPTDGDYHRETDCSFTPHFRIQGGQVVHYLVFDEDGKFEGHHQRKEYSDCPKFAIMTFPNGIKVPLQEER